MKRTSLLGNPNLVSEGRKWQQARRKTTKRVDEKRDFPPVGEEELENVKILPTI